MTDAANPRSRGEYLKKLREEHSETVKRTQALLRDQKQFQQQICQAIRENKRTVPEIAAAINQPAHEVLWYLAVYKKYGIVVEDGMCDDYVQYKLVKEA